MSFSGWIAQQLSWELIKFGTFSAYKKVSSRKKIDGWSERLETKFFNEVKIVDPDAATPKIYIDGEYQLDETVEVVRREKLKEIRRKHKHNDVHAIVVSDDFHTSDESAEIRVKTCDFAGVLALRNFGEKPSILSVSAVIVCDQTDEIILHRRSSSVDTYPDALHTIGGSYIPPMATKVSTDRGGVISAIQREALEEGQISVDVDSKPSMIFSRELSTGFFQVVFLGLKTSKDNLERMCGNWEGTAIRVKLSKIDSILSSDDWVPSGKAHLLAWLAHGSPGVSSKRKFGNFRPEELFLKHSK